MPCATAGAAASAVRATGATPTATATAAALRRADMRDSSERSFGQTADPWGVISKLARRIREIACWRRVREILMVGLREC
ncbi:hypothetical protein GCM10010317_024260 [Streptomyces mirabilis]|nr:hypothetical protein GCM10010317_024260 [Streptomyces mirabilis]